MTAVRLSRAQLRMLASARDHGDPWSHVRGQAQHGGSHSTMVSLVGLKLLVQPEGLRKRKWKVSAEARKILREANL